MTKEHVEVTIDVHEPPEITAAVDAHPEVEDYKFENPMPAGDLEINGIGFERKTVSDYVNTLKGSGTHTLDEQLHKLNQRYEIAYLLIDGDMSETENPFKSDMPGEAIRGSWASLTAREDSGVQAVIPCSNPALLVDEAVRLARKHIEPKQGDYIPKPIDNSDYSVTAMMYACIPSVGATLAQELEDEFPTIADFMNRADFDTLQEVDGIGEKRALKIIDEFV